MGGVSEVSFSIRKKSALKHSNGPKHEKRNKIFFSIMIPHTLPGLQHITYADMSTNRLSVRKQSVQS